MMLIFVLSYLPFLLQADLFFYREPEESKEQQEEETAPAADYDYGAAAIAGASDKWGGQISDAQWAVDAVAPAILLLVELQMQVGGVVLWGSVFSGFCLPQVYYLKTDLS